MALMFLARCSQGSILLTSDQPTDQELIGISFLFYIGNPKAAIWLIGFKDTHRHAWLVAKGFFSWLQKSTRAKENTDSILGVNCCDCIPGGKMGKWRLS